MDTIKLQEWRDEFLEIMGSDEIDQHKWDKLCELYREQMEQRDLVDELSELSFDECESCKL